MPPFLGVQLGEYQGGTSFVVYSVNGIQQCNVHPDLRKILSGTRAVDIVDLALGCTGRYFIKYRSGTAIKKAISPETWVAIQNRFPGSIQDISRVCFGNPDEFWAVVEQNGQSRQILKVRKQISDILQPLNAPHPAVTDIGFIALGKSVNHFAVKIRSTVILGGHRGVQGKAKSQQAKAKNNKMTAVAFSPNDASSFFALFDDGSHRMAVDKKLGKILKPHLKLAAKVAAASVPAPAPAAVPPATRAPPVFVPSTIGAAPPIQAPPLYMDPPIFIQDSFRVPPCTSSGATQLRLMDWYEPDYKRVQTLFHQGWKHPQKTPIPWLRYMYEIRLPTPVLMNYCMYRRKMSLARDLAASAEYELFHGTGRQCTLGNERDQMKLCKSLTCRMCRILTLSFAVNKAGSAPGRSFLRFGQGIYTSSVSSKADDYTDMPSDSKYRAMLVARVVLGKAYPLHLTTPHLTGPPTGYDSVIGQVGVHLNHDEQVVYNEDAVRPAYLIIYKY